MKFTKIEAKAKENLYKTRDNNRTSVASNGVLYWNSGIYGEKNDNAFPDFLIDVAEGGAGTSIHSNIIGLKSNLITGNNLEIQDPNQQGAQQAADFIEKRNRRNENLKTSYAFNARQFALFEQAYVQVVYSRDYSRIAETYAVPVKDVRASGLDSMGNIPMYFVSKRWNDISRSNYRKASIKNMATAVPPYTGREHAKRLGQPVQLLHIKRPDYQDVYTNPSYMGGMNWILISNYISNFHANNFKNNYFIQGMLVTYGQMTQDSEKQFVMDLEDLFMGAQDQNQKKLMLANVENKEMKPEFVSARDMMQDKEFDSLINQANQQVVFAHNCYPILAGMERKGSDIGGDNTLMNSALRNFITLTTDPLKDHLVGGYNRLMEDMGLPLLAVDSSNMIVGDDEKMPDDVENPNTDEGNDAQDTIDETDV
jgi:hypothetical protein